MALRSSFECGRDARDKFASVRGLAVFEVLVVESLDRSDRETFYLFAHVVWRCAGGGSVEAARAGFMRRRCSVHAALFHPHPNRSFQVTTSAFQGLQKTFVSQNEDYATRAGRFLIVRASANATTRRYPSPPILAGHRPALPVVLLPLLHIKGKVVSATSLTLVVQVVDTRSMRNNFKQGGYQDNIYWSGTRHMPCCQLLDKPQQPQLPLSLRHASNRCTDMQSTTVCCLGRVGSEQSLSEPPRLWVRAVVRASV